MTARNVATYNFPKIKFCKLGHAIVGENIYVEGRGVRCRQCRRVTQHKTQATGNFGEALVRKVVTAVNEGMSIQRMTGRRGHTFVGPFVVARVRLLAFCKANPKLGNWILKKTAENAKNSRREAAILRRAQVAAPALVRNMGVLTAIEAVVPRYLSAADRQDIIADMWMAVAEGRLHPGEIGTQVKRFVAAHHKMYPTTDRWAPTSLDSPVHDNNPLPRIERIAAGEGVWS
jgi:hypothetical protein